MLWLKIQKITVKSSKTDSYEVPNSWQGKYSSLQVIGDKNGGANSSLLSENPDLLVELENVIQLKPKLIHVIRNPFDIITTVTFRKFEKRKITDPPSDEDLLPMIEKFLLRADSVMKIKSQGNFEIFDLYHEDFIKNPKFNLEKLIAFLGVDADNDYLEACSSIVYSSPHKSRLRIEWPEELIKYVESKLLKYPFLKHYKYSN